MISIRPLARALVPVDPAAARRISAPNYDEFQGDEEVWELIRAEPASVLSVTMSHCDAPSLDECLEADSEAALARATANMASLREGGLTRTVGPALFVYEIAGPSRPGVRQIGLGGLARTAEIRTESTPDGTIIRNEGIREKKARGRARLIEATGALIGTVNNAVEDREGRLADALERWADARDPDYAVTSASGDEHRIWLVTEPGAIARLGQVLADEPEAYVADGNHRSAAAAMLGYESFLAVFFPAGRMGISPYNRLVADPPLEGTSLDDAIRERFEIGPAPSRPFQPTRTHTIGLYDRGEGWRSLSPRPGSFDPDDAAASIDHAIVQRGLFAEALGIEDAGDERLTFVGANKDAAWLARQVDDGRAALAVTLPAVTMEQFIAVCRQRRMMPPKSTWFEPKIRSGLVMALLD
jgi:uncharacterized protein (DUF1015 family)